ncbi:glutaredoxin family protein [Neobacillus muris]|uniref:glutaredoxin family protein n=1 Tax=Neobacillus muris TaxID=2941334 RepID=UPI00203D648A|nr:glutaredoxin family protein [Neobacillus muris]
MIPQTITLYTRKSCPLCDKAKQALLEMKDEISFKLEEIDIYENDELTERFGLMIPVVYINGEQAAYGQINKFDIRKRLQENISNL